MRRPTLAAGVVAAVLAAALLSAQAPPASQSVFRASTDYVQLDVVVTDKNDKAISDLSQDDFEITEHGQPQTITDFGFVAIPATHRSVADIKTTAPTIDVVSNTHSPSGRQWVLVIDDLHIIENHAAETRTVIQKFLEQLAAEDQVAIVFVGRSDLSQGFTSDLGAQMRTVNRIRDALGFAPDSNDMMSPSQASSPRDLHRYAIATVDVLKNVCASLAKSSYPRKALVYVSEGMTYRFEPGSGDAGDVFDQMVEAFGSARRAGVPVYTIDPRGPADCTAVRGMCTMDIGLIHNIFLQQQQMRTIAENTGGLAFVGASDMDRAVRELVEDNSSFYLLGYYPQPFVRDGKFHDVKVSVKRPGARIRARAGYDAPKAVSVSTTDTKQTLEETLRAALPASGLSLRAFAAPIEPGLHGMRTAVTVEVIYPAPPDGSKIDDTLQFGLLALDHDGQVKGSTRRAFHFTGAANGAVEVTYAINDVIELPSQPLVLRVAVASQSLRVAGAVHVPVEAANPSHGDLQVGTIVIGLAGPPREQAVPPGALNGLLPFQPTTTRTFESTDDVRVFARVFWGSKDEAAQVTLSVTGTSSMPPKVVTVARPRGAAGRADAALDTTLPLANLLPGPYVMTVDVKLPSGQAARRTVAFVIQ